MLLGWVMVTQSSHSKGGFTVGKFFWTFISPTSVAITGRFFTQVSHKIWRVSRKKIGSIEWASVPQIRVRSFTVGHSIVAAFLAKVAWCRCSGLVARSDCRSPLPWSNSNSDYHFFVFFLQYPSNVQSMLFHVTHMHDTRSPFGHCEVSTVYPSTVNYCK